MSGNSNFIPQRRFFKKKRGKFVRDLFPISPKKKKKFIKYHFVPEPIFETKKKSFDECKKPGKRKLPAFEMDLSSVRKFGF